MRTPVIAAAAIALASLAAPGRAAETREIETRNPTIIIGGLAGRCSEDAKAGNSAAAAVERCTLALISEPLNRRARAGTLVNRGALHLMRKETRAASTDFEAAARLLPTLGEAYVGRGGVLIARESWAAAEPEITRGIELGLEEPEKAYFFRGVARWGQDNYRGAYFDFRKAQELAPDWELPAEQLVHFQVSPAR